MSPRLIDKINALPRERLSDVEQFVDMIQGHEADRQNLRDFGRASQNSFKAVLASNSLQFGAIVLVRFPFTDQLTAKQRPAVVTSGVAYNNYRSDVIVMAITSQMTRSAEYAYVEIAHWQAAGLLKPSLIKPVIATIEQTTIVRTLGKLSSADLSAIHEMLDIIKRD